MPTSNGETSGSDPVTAACGVVLCLPSPHCVFTKCCQGDIDSVALFVVSAALSYVLRAMHYSSLEYYLRDSFRTNYITIHSTSTLIELDPFTTVAY